MIMDTSIWGYAITALSSSGITAIVNAIINRRKNSAQVKTAEVEATEGAFEALQGQVEHLKKSLNEAYATTQKMQEVINEFRRTNIQLTKELASAQMALAKAQARDESCSACLENTKNR